MFMWILIVYKLYCFQIAILCIWFGTLITWEIFFSSRSSSMSSQIAIMCIWFGTLITWEMFFSRKSSSMSFHFAIMCIWFGTLFTWEIFSPVGVLLCLLKLLLCMIWHTDYTGNLFLQQCFFHVFSNCYYVLMILYTGKTSNT